MLDLGLIVNVVIGVAVYKIIIATIEFACIKTLEKLLFKQIKATTRKERIDKAIKLADEELKKTQLN